MIHDSRFPIDQDRVQPGSTKAGIATLLSHQFRSPPGKVALRAKREHQVFPGFSPAHFNALSVRLHPKTGICRRAGHPLNLHPLEDVRLAKHIAEYLPGSNRAHRRAVVSSKAHPRYRAKGSADTAWDETFAKIKRCRPAGSGEMIYLATRDSS
jgi:hypothetical protein